MNADIHYRITPVSLGGHRFSIELTIRKPDPVGQLLLMPAWIPGSYLIRDFAKHLGKVTARSGDKPVRVIKKDKNTWQLGTVSAPVVVSYEVYAHDTSVRGAHLDMSHGFFNGSSVFLYVNEQHEQPVTVEICPPAEAPDSTWRVATTLTSAGASLWGFGHYRADDYEELIDHPVEMGTFELVRFSVAGVPHFIAISGRQRSLTSRLARDTKAVCEQHVRLFGELPKMEKYLFLIRVEESGYGGLEHRSSCALVCSRQQLPDDDDKVESEYCRLLGLISHEYFHLWNIKRIKPAAFMPYDLRREAYTEQLWVFEGITSYYDDLALLRAGVIDEKTYFTLIETSIGKVRGTFGAKVQSLAESSFDAWVKFYKPDDNTPNAVVSYYVKGSLVALALDLTIRQRTSDRKSLDDVMRAMWQMYGQPLTGVPEDGFEELVDSVSGLSMRPFFAAMVRGVDEIPLESVLLDCGVSLEPAAEDKPEAELGVTLTPESLTIKTVRRDSCAETAGIAAGDTLVAIDGLRVKPTTFERLMTACHPGEEIKVHVFRRDELLSLSVRLAQKHSDQYRLTLSGDESDKQHQRRRHWLYGKTELV